MKTKHSKLLSFQKQTTLFLILAILPFYMSSQTLDDIKKRGVLRVAFTSSGTETVNKLAAEEFARFLDVELQEVIIEWKDVFSKNGKTPSDYQTNPQVTYTPDVFKKADILCGTIYELDWRRKFFDYAGIVQVSDLLIVKKEGKVINDFEDLGGLTIAFLKESSYQKDIEEINKTLTNKIKCIPTNSEEESLALLHKGEVSGIVAVSYLALNYIKENNSKYKLAFPVAEPKNVGWIMPNNSKFLKKEINHFFKTIEGTAKLNDLFIQKYKIGYATYIDIINSYAQSKYGKKTRDFDDIVKSGKIILALREREMVYRKSGKKQFNHLLAEKFVEFLGLEMELVITDKFSDYFENEEGEIIEEGTYMPKWFSQFDVACDLIAPLDWRLKKFDVIGHMPNAEVVIGRKDSKITSVKDLINLEGVTLEASSYEHSLTTNNIHKYHYSPGDAFFEELKNGKADYTISNIAVFNLAKHPELEAKFIIGEITYMGWAIKKNQPKLKQKVLEFFENARESGLLDSAFKEQTGLTITAANNYLTALRDTYQKGYFHFDFYGTEQALPQENILSIFQDKKSYMWFGTHNGAVKYNGRSMKLYSMKEGLISNSVLSIKEDALGNIYFATLNGISILNGKTKKITNHFKGISFRNIFFNDNRIWFYGESGIYELLNNKEVCLNKTNISLPKKIHSLSKNKKTGTIAIASSEGLFLLYKNNSIYRMNNNFCNYAYFDYNGNLWTSMESNLYFADEKMLNNLSIGENANSHLGVKNETINEIYESKDGAIWFISDYKIYQLITLNQQAFVYDKNIGLKQYRILSTLVDNEGIVWFGFAGGLQKLTNKSLRILYPEKLNGHVNSIFEDKNNKIWLGLNKDIYLLSDKLENISKKLGFEKASFSSALLLNGNVLIANKYGFYVLDISHPEFKVVEKRKFKKPLFRIERIYLSKKNELFLLTEGNGIVYYLKDFKSKIKVIENKSSRAITEMLEYNSQIIGTNNNGLVVFKNDSFKPFLNLNIQTWSLCKNTYSSNSENNLAETLWIGTQKGLGILENNKFRYVSPNLFENTAIYAIELAEDKECIWLGTSKGLIYYNKVEKIIKFTINSKDGLPGSEISVGGLFLDGRGLLWIGTYHGPASFDIKKNIVSRHVPITRLESIKLNGKYIDSIKDKLNYNENNFVFEISGLSFKDETLVKYEFYLQGLDNDYTASVGNNNIAKYSNLPPGKYSFKYRAKGKDNIWCYYQSVNFKIEKPFYAKLWFFIVVFIAFLLTIWWLFKWRMKVLEKKNKELEELVENRTSEIRSQNTVLKKQKDEIEVQHRNIKASIQYAKKIQYAVLPSQKDLSDVFKNYFVFFRPKGIVSGDFYWLKEFGSKTVIVAADCTGHGVPGAFMSMLGTSFLNEIVTENKETTGELLDELREKVKISLRQTGDFDEAKDGMDIAICVIDKKKKEVQFSGAYNPLCIVRNGEMKIYKSDRQPIAIYRKEQKFTTQTIDLEWNDILYIYSDGYADQLGGEFEEKFMAKKFRKLLLDISPETMPKQKEILENRMAEWQGELEQIDDMLIVGIKFTD